MYCRFLLAVFALALIFHIPSQSLSQDVPCQTVVARLVSLQGQADVLPHNSSTWAQVSMNHAFCPGDKLRIHQGGRALVVLPNDSLIRLKQKSTLQFQPPRENGLSIISLIKGVFHLFSHQTRSLEVVTPYVNGLVEGTEFLVKSQENSTSIHVYQGMVRAQNESSSQTIIDGQSLVAKKDQDLRYLSVPATRDAVTWTLYYPTLFDETGDSDISAPIESASKFLATGQVDEATRILETLGKQEKANPETLAIESIINVVQGNTTHGLELAQIAVAQDSSSSHALLALSYAEQATFDIEGALATLKLAQEGAPQNSEINARLAELLLATGQVDNAVAAAEKAVVLSPQSSRAHSVLGFSYLAQLKPDPALQAFEVAISSDSELPLARLGKGLALIRTGDLAQGRKEIELAVAHNPGDSLLRSYLGKAYFEEKRSPKADRQLAMAKTLDPNDPTPWFYDAINKQANNRPVEALHDIQKSIELNNNRAIYRSRFLLDSDLAARSATLGRIYTDVGFSQLAQSEGYHSVNTSPQNYSAHRFLADIYSTKPRHEIARVSELLVSQLLQPINLNPVQPRLAENSGVTLEQSGADGVSFNEFNPLFFKNRFALQATGLAGSNNTYGDELTHSAIWNNFSYSVGQYYYTTDGIRENNDQERQIYNGFVQSLVSTNTSLLAEIRHKRNDNGDTLFQFDPAIYDSTFSQEDATTSLRIGARHQFHPGSTLLATGVFSAIDDDAELFTSGLPYEIESSSENYMGELLHLYNCGALNVQSGIGYYHADFEDSITLGFPLNITTTEDNEAYHFNLYSYGSYNLLDNLGITLGLSADQVENQTKDRNELSPKFGINYQPLANTKVRAAAFKTTHRNFIAAQTVEPTQISGFNQFYDDTESTTSWNYGIGIDQKISKNFFTGAFYLVRELSVPFTQYDLFGNATSLEDDWQEQIGSAYIYWAPLSWLTVGLDYYYERYEHDTWEGIQGIESLTTHRLKPQINFISSCGLNTRIEANYIDQEGSFGFNPFFTDDSDQFWVFDLKLSYRMPNRRGIIAFEINNLFDEEFKYLDTDPNSSRFMPEQQLLLKITFAL